MVERISYAIIRWRKAKRVAHWVQISECVNLSLNSVYTCHHVGELRDLPTEWKAPDLVHCVAVKTSLPKKAIAVVEVADE